MGPPLMWSDKRLRKYCKEGKYKRLCYWVDLRHEVCSSTSHAHRHTLSVPPSLPLSLSLSLSPTSDPNRPDFRL